MKGESDHLAFQAGVVAADLRAFKECRVDSDQQSHQIWSGTIVRHNVQWGSLKIIYIQYIFP